SLGRAEQPMVLIARIHRDSAHAPGRVGNATFLNRRGPEIEPREPAAEGRLRSIRFGLLDLVQRLLPGSRWHFAQPSLLALQPLFEAVKLLGGGRSFADFCIPGFGRYHTAEQYGC